MKRLAIIFLAGFIFLGLKTLHAQDVSKESDAIFKNVSKTYTLTASGTIEQRVIKEVKLLTYNSFHKIYGETFVVYNPMFQQLKLNECYTIMANGKKVVTPKNAFNEVLPRFAAGIPAWNHLKEMVITHTGLEIGATIYLDYTLVTKAGFMPALMGQEVLTEASPIENLTLEFRVLEKQPFNFRIFNLDAQPEIKNDREYRVFTWKIKNLPAILPEPGQPKDLKFIPTLVYSTAADFREVFTWLTSQPAFSFNRTEAMAEVVKKIKNDSKDDLETALKLQDMVVNEFTTWGIPSAYTGFHAQTPAETWKNAGGTELDKAVLLTALLLEAKIEASPIALFLVYFDEGMGNLFTVESFPVQLKSAENNWTWLSAIHTDEYNPMVKCASQTYVPLIPGKFTKNTVAATKVNSCVLSGNLSLTPENQISGKLTLALKGSANPSYDLKINEKRAMNYIRGFSSSDQKDCKVEQNNGSLIAITVSRENACHKQGDYYFLDLPYTEKGFNGWHLGEMPQTRRNPYEIPCPVADSVSFTIQLPSNMTLVNAIPRKEISNHAGSVIVEAIQTGQMVMYRKFIRLEPSGKNELYYQELRDLVGLWNNKTYNILIYK